MIKTTVFARKGLACLLCMLSVAQLSAAKVVDIPERVVKGKAPVPLHSINEELVFDSDEIGNLEIKDVSDLPARVPGLGGSFSGHRGFGDSISYRGLGNTLFFSKPSVVLYVDDVAQGDVFAQSMDFSEVDSIRFYRGFQGSRFGQNAQAGVIEVETAKPTNKFHGEAIGEYGSYNSYDARLNLSGPMVKDELYFGLSAFYAERDGYMYNKTLRRRVDQKQSEGGSFKLMWIPTDDWEITLSGGAQDYDDGGHPQTSLTATDLYETVSNELGQTLIGSNQQALRIKRDFQWGTLKSITSRNEWEIDPSFVDLDLSAAATSHSTIIMDQVKWTEELRVESDNDSDFTWKTGLFFSDAQTNGWAQRFFVAFAREQTSYRYFESNYAGYANGKYRFNDSTEIDFGLRLDRYESRLTRAKVSNIAAADANLDLSDSTFNYAPDLGVTHSFNKMVSVYGKTGLAFKPGGFSAYTANTNAANSAGFKDERAWTNEAGVVVQNKKRNFMTRLGFFWYDVDDYQYEASVTGTTDYTVYNGGHVISRGLEWEFTAQPCEHTVLYGNVAYTDAEFEEHINPLVAGSDLSGKSVPFVPRYTANAGARFILPLDFYLQADVRGFGETHYEETNLTVNSQKAYYLLDLAVGYEHDYWSVKFFANNVTDEDYFTNISPAITAGAVGAPQTFGVRLSARF